MAFFQILGDLAQVSVFVVNILVLSANTYIGLSLDRRGAWLGGLHRAESA